MDFSTDQNDKVSTFFDRISDDYRERYGPQNPFHSYFFRERLQAATEGIQFENKIVLDVGAGTGPLWDYLAKYPGVDYYACDISPMMLAQSSNPGGPGVHREGNRNSVSERQIRLHLLVGRNYLSNAGRIKRNAPVYRESSCA